MGPETKLRILFVDDEAMVLNVLRLAVASMKGAWEAGYANSGQEALDLMAKQAFDVIVTDMRMPGMTGVELLNTTLKLYPQTVRIVMTGFVELDMVNLCVGSTHQFLHKPFELRALKDVLERVTNLRRRLRSPEILTLVTRTGSIPSMPELYFKIIEALQVPDSPVERIAEIVASDPGMTAKTLQLVNSAFFGFAQRISTPREAVMLLGTSRIRSLALTFHLFSTFALTPGELPSVDSVWTHSLRVAHWAERIARMEGTEGAVAEQAFTAGLLHEIGKLILASHSPAKYRQVLATAENHQRPVSEVEREVFQATHGEVGACLLDLWGLPTPLVEALLYHNEPSQAPPAPFNALAAVSIADVLEHETQAARPGQRPRPFDQAFLDRLHLRDRIGLWRQQLSAFGTFPYHLNT